MLVFSSLFFLHFSPRRNKLASFKAIQVWNYNPPTDSQTGEECRATSVAKNIWDVRCSGSEFISDHLVLNLPLILIVFFCLFCIQHLCWGGGGSVWNQRHTGRLRQLHQKNFCIFTFCISIFCIRNFPLGGLQKELLADSMQQKGKILYFANYICICILYTW